MEFQPLDGTRPMEVQPEVYEPSHKEIKAWRKRMVEIMERGSPAERKAMFQSFVHELLVEGCDSIIPTFRLGGPDTLSDDGEAVRALSRSCTQLYTMRTQTPCSEGRGLAFEARFWDSVPLRSLAPATENALSVRRDSTDSSYAEDSISGCAEACGPDSVKRLNESCNP
jgi:hypothetical protein